MKISIRTYNSRKITTSLIDIEKDLIGLDLPMLPYYKEAYEYAKILSLNKTFISELKRIRSKYDFDKLTLEEIDKIYNDSFEKEKVRKNWEEIRIRVKEAVQELSKKFYLNDILIKLADELVLYGFFDPDEYAFVSSISFSYDKENNIYEILIHRSMSKNLLLKFIDKYWDDISESMNNLPKYHQISLSDRDYRIVELRDEENLKYKNIVEKIIKEFKLNNKDGSINEDSLKSAYTRAKKLINSFNIK